MFDDLEHLADSILTVRSIRIGGFTALESLQFTYILKDGSIYRPPVRGESFALPETIRLAKGEYVAKIEGTVVLNESLGQVFITIKNPNNHKSRVYGPFGANVGERSFTFEGYILGIHGRIGPKGIRNITRTLGVYHLATVKESAFFGYPIPVATFYENPDFMFPPVTKISKILVHHGDAVNSLQTEYKLLNGSTRLAGRNGGDGENFTTVSLEYGEELTGMNGMVVEGPWSFDFIGQITFMSRKKDGSTAVYGPFGKSGSKPISVRGHILGFTGAANTELLLSLGAFYYV
jgi:hypothetical protein